MVEVRLRVRQSLRLSEWQYSVGGQQDCEGTGLCPLKETSGEGSEQEIDSV